MRVNDPDYACVSCNNIRCLIKAVTISPKHQHVPLYPLHNFTDYNQSMNSPEACRRRLLKYLIPVVIFSVVFNIPKFLEAEIYWKITVDENATEGGQTAENSSLTYHEQPRVSDSDFEHFLKKLPSFERFRCSRR